MNIVDWIISIFARKEPTVDSVVSGFAQAAADLREVSMFNIEMNEEITDEINRLNHERNQRSLEAARADAIADKLEDIFG